MKRGFKTEAERRAQRLRLDMGLPAHARVPPAALAEHLNIQVVLADTLVNRADLEELERLQPGAFSAATFQLPAGPVIVTNPVGASPGRTNSDLAHELAHVLLQHAIRTVERVGTWTFFTCDPEQEQEANWLAGCLLLPRPLLLAAATAGKDAATVAAENQVSDQMASYRLNTSGVLLQVARRRRAVSSLR